MVTLKSSTRRLVTSIEFSKAPFYSNIMRFHGCCSLFNFCEYEANHADRGLFGLSRKDPDTYSLCTDYSDNGSEYYDVSHIIEVEVHVNKFSWLNMSFSTVVP